MNQIVRPEPMFGCMAESQFLELSLQLWKFDLNRTKKSGVTQINPKGGVRRRGLFYSNAGLSTILGGEDMQLERIDKLQPMKPCNRQRRIPFSLCLGNQMGGLFRFEEAEVETGEEIRIGVTFHSPAINLSARRVWARDSVFGNSFASRARKSGTAVIRSGPESGRIV